MHRKNLSFSLFFTAFVQIYGLIAQEHNTDTLQSNSTTQKSLFDLIDQMRMSAIDTPLFSGGSGTYIDIFNPLGPTAKKIRNLSYQISQGILSPNERGLWIKFRSDMLLYKNQRIWSIGQNCGLNEVDIDTVNRELRKTIRMLIKLEKNSPYAKNIIHTLQYSKNKFILSVVNITESYTLLPLSNNRLGFLSNNAYAFQALEKDSLMVDYAPFNQIGSGAEIRWTPTLGIITLAHELAHAYDANYGLLDDRLMYAYGEVMLAREIRALYHENLIRKELGMRLKYKAITGGALIFNGKPFTYQLPVLARY